MAVTASTAMAGCRWHTWCGSDSEHCYGWCRWHTWCGSDSEHCSMPHSVTQQYMYSADLCHICQCSRLPLHRLQVVQPLGQQFGIQLAGVVGTHSSVQAC